MNMRIRTVLSYMAFLFTAALLVNCESPLTAPLNPYGSSAQDAGRGAVVIHIADGNAGQRTILPATAFSHYTLAFTSEGKEPVTLSSENARVELDLENGSWEVTVNGYVTIGGTPYLAAQGRKTITVTPGTPVNVSVIMTIAADPAGEAGTLSYAIDLSLETASLSRALLVLEPLGGGAKTEIDLKEAEKRTGTLTLEPGFYLLKVQLENGYQALGKTEVVHIYPNMETNAAYTFGSGDLTRVVPISGTAVTGGVPPGKAGVFLYGDAEYEDLIAHTEVNLSDMTWQTVIPDVYDRVYFQLGIDNGAGFVFKAAGYEDIPENGKTGITIPAPKILSFSISAAETGLSADLTGAIDETQSTISLATQGWIENIASLKAAFESTGTVTVNGTAQESGVTGQDFRSDLVYRVTTEDNATKDYTVVFESPQATGLPVMKIDTQGNQSITSKETYVYTNIRIIDPGNSDNNFEHTDYSDRIRGRGNATWTSYPKKPYKIKLDGKTDMLGMGKDKDWVLLANYCDKTLLRTAIAFKLSELLGFDWTPKARFVELFLNGEYMGNYQLVEGIKQGEKRVAIPETGYIIERDGYYLAEPKYFVTDKDIGYSFKNPDTDDLSDTQWNYIKDYMNEFEGVLYSSSFDDPVDGYSKYIDTESFARWFLFQNILANIDTNPYLLKADNTGDSKLFMGPVWDFEWSLGIGWYEGGRPRPANYWVCNGWYFEKLCTDDLFVQELQDMWNQNKTHVEQEVLQFINEAKDGIMKSQAMNFRRWDIMNKRVSVGGIPLGGFEAEVACDRQFFMNRMDWLDEAIDEL